MDISQISSITELKAMAFDAIKAIEIQQQNLRLIQERMGAVQSEPDAVETACEEVSTE